MTQEEGTCEGFARRHHLVTLDPHAAYGFKAAFLDIFLYLIEKNWILLLDELVDSRLALQKAIVRVLLHESNCLAEIIVSHLLSLRECPQPIHIHVGMSYQMERVPCHISILLHRLCY